MGCFAVSGRKDRMKKSLFSWLFLAALAGVRPVVAQDVTITIHASDSAAAEGFSDPGTFTVRRAGETNFSVLVFYELSGTASNGVDYAELRGTVEIPAGATNASFTVIPIDDSRVEGTEVVLARVAPSPLQCPTCGYEIGDPTAAEVFIRDNDREGNNEAPLLNFYEPQDGRVFTAPVDVRLQAFAQDREDGYSLKVEFFEGERSLGFGTFEPTTCPAPYCPYFMLVWSNAPPGVYELRAKATDSHGATTVSGITRITVNESNPPPAIVNVLATDDTATEIPQVPPGLYIAQRVDLGIFTVIRTGRTNQALRVSYAVRGTASNGVDYAWLPGEVTIPAGESSANVEVAAIDDFAAEGTETVALMLQPPWWTRIEDRYVLGPQSNAVVQIVDNEPGPTNRAPFVRLDDPENGRVYYTQTSTNIYLQAFAQDEEDGYFVDVEFFEGTRSLGHGTFNGTRCAYYCPYYSLMWTNVPPGRYVLTARATDRHGAMGTSAPVNITVADVRPQGAVNVSATDPVATEVSPLSAQPPDTGTFTVRREDGTNFGIVVFYEITGTGSNGVDYEMLSGHVALPAGVSSAEINVSPIDDLISEGTESVTVTLIPQCPPCIFAVPFQCGLPSGTNCFPIGPHSSATISLRDNDEAKELPVVNIIARDPVAAEGRTFWWRDAQEQSSGATIANWWDVNRGGTNTATFVVRRDGPTNSALAVEYEIGGSASNGVDYATLAGTVTIEAGRRTARIAVVPIDDARAEGLESVKLTVKASEDYRIGFPARGSAIIVDNDRERPSCGMISDRQFHLCRPATNGFSYRIEASTNLTQWAPVCTNVVTEGALHFVDPEGPASRARFYRVVAEPPLSRDD